MVTSCVVPQCPNYYTSKCNISYFRFPNSSKHPDLHKAWLEAIGKPNLKPTRYTVVCELHFNENDFDETYKMKKFLMPNDYFRPTLKQSAVPKVQLQGLGNSKLENNKKWEILRELLGESYLRWKMTPEDLRNVVKMSDESDDTSESKEVKKEVETGGKVKKEVGDCRKRVFNLTTNYILKKPLKPLPEDLQRILPSVLSVVIKKEAPSYKNISIFRNEGKILTPSSKGFNCLSDFGQFYSCDRCNFTTSLKVNLFKHSRTAHRPISKAVFRLPVKMCKYQEPKRYSCTSCDFSTFSKLFLLKHFCRYIS